MKSFLRECKIGLIASLLIFVPYLTIIYLWVQWNKVQTDNLTEGDFTTVTFRAAHIYPMKEESMVNKHPIITFYTLIYSDVPKAKWRVETEKVKRRKRVNFELLL